MSAHGTDAGDSFASGLVKRAAAIFAGVQVFSFLKGSVQQATESAVVMRATEAVIKSTGGAAGVTADQIGALSTKLSQLSGVDDELIQHGANVIATFTGIKNAAGEGNDIFDQTNLAALNLSVALKTDLQSASILVGKALNDPVKGVTALRRAGVQLTEQQTEQVKKFVEVGDVMSAQKIILGELAVEFGGAAEAAATPADKAKVAWGNFQELLGGLLLPAIGKVSEIFTSKVEPALRVGIELLTKGWSGGVRDGAGFMEQFGAIAHRVFTVIGDILQNVVWPVIKDVVTTLHDLVGWVNQGSSGAQVFRAVVIGLTAAFVAYKVAMTAIAVWTGIVTAAQWLWNIALNANPIGLIILAVIALVAAIFYLWTHSAGFRNFFIGIWEHIWGFLKAVGGWFAGPFADFFKKGWHFIEDVIKLGVAIFKFYWQLIQDVVAAVAGWIEQRINTFVANFKAILAGIGVIVGWFVDTFNRVRQAVADGISGAISFVAGLPGRILAAIGNLGSLLYNAGADIVRGLWEGIQSLGSWVADKVRGFINQFVPGPVRRLLGIESPSKVFAEIGANTVEGFAVGFGLRARQLDGALTLPLPVGPAGLANTPIGGWQREAGGGTVRLDPDDLRALARIIESRPVQVHIDDRIGAQADLYVRGR